MALRLVPDALEDEDMMEMLNAGLIRIMVVDQWKADLWAQVLRKITVHRTIAVRTGVKVGWAMRKDTPKLAEVVNEFITFARGKRRRLSVLPRITAGSSR